MLKFVLLIILSFSLIGCDPSSPKTPKQPTPVTNSEENVPPKPSGTSLLTEEEIENIADRIDKFTNTPPEDDSKITFGDYYSNRPSAWFWVPPKSQLVTCNYIVPSIDESEHAVFSVTQFPDDQGGIFVENVARWKRLFRSNDGSPVKPNIEVITANNHDAVIAEFDGEYMGAGAAWHLKDHSLLIAEVREEGISIYFKLLGPTNTVKAHRPHFLTLLRDITASSDNAR